MARPKRLCSIPDCGKPHYGHDFCSGHYERFKKHGDPMGGRTPNGEGLHYLETVVFPYRGDDCLIWPYYKDGTGYGRVRFGDRHGAVHRLACEQLHGPAPSIKHEAAHNCGNRGCVNPTHIRWATTVENNADKLFHDTHNRGDRNGMSKLTEPQARSIKKALKEGRLLQREIASRMGVCQQTVSNISRGRNWAWLQTSEETGVLQE